MPAVAKKGGKTFVDTAAESFDSDLLAFFEDYMSLCEMPDRLSGSRFALTDETGKGMAALLDTLTRMENPPLAVKGQVTGPITFCTGVKDQDDRSIFYNETLRDAAVKHLALNARWQIDTLSGPGCPAPGGRLLQSRQVLFYAEHFFRMLPSVRPNQQSVRRCEQWLTGI